MGDDSGKMKDDITRLMTPVRRIWNQQKGVGVVSEVVDSGGAEKSSKKQFVILRAEETHGRKRVTTVEERVERGSWTEIRDFSCATIDLETTCHYHKYMKVLLCQ